MALSSSMASTSETPRERASSSSFARTLQSPAHLSGDWIVQAIRACGPKFLAETLIAEGRNDVLKAQYAQDDICELCGSMMSKPETVEILRSALASQERQRQIAIAR